MNLNSNFGIPRLEMDVLEDPPADLYQSKSTSTDEFACSTFPKRGMSPDFKRFPQSTLHIQKENEEMSHLAEKNGALSDRSETFFLPPKSPRMRPVFENAQVHSLVKSKAIQFLTSRSSIGKPTNQADSSRSLSHSINAEWLAASLSTLALLVRLSTFSYQ
uniref:Uncharacterized protein n=1 Tax=Ditylenchus dipsaci TaxID=166011 RepID=A0A915DXG8_9BILA